MGMSTLVAKLGKRGQRHFSSQAETWLGEDGQIPKTWRREAAQVRTLEEL